MKKKITNVPASVRARLLKRAKAEKRPFNELLQYYAMERFLYRLSRSAHADRFILKGGLMLQLWGASLTRSTKDIDLHRESTASVDELTDIMKSCLEVDAEDDGLSFDLESVVGEQIRLSAQYDGVRVRLRGLLGTARINVQVDIGFGDAITPNAKSISYPTLLDFQAPILLGYPPETMIAEKFEALVTLDMANTRLKDFLDIWTLIQSETFEGAVMADAIKATFNRRRTLLPKNIPIGLTPAFSEARDKQTQWTAYLRKSNVQGDVPTLTNTVMVIANFIMPVVDAITADLVFSSTWTPGGPWESKSESPYWINSKKS